MSSTHPIRSAPPHPMLPRAATNLGSIRVAVDMSLLRPGGENGGVKPFIFAYLRELARLEGGNITFVFLTWACSHAEVRALKRAHDEIVCVRAIAGETLADVEGWRSHETIWLNPPPDFLLHFNIALLYTPFGSAEYACPGIPMVSTIVDVLHRDFPSSLDAPTITHREQVFQELITSCDWFQCISSYTAARLSEHYAVDPERIFRTYIVIHDRLPTSRLAQRPTPEPYFFYPANGWRHKNHETLLVAYRLYRKRAGDSAWELILTGHDDDRMQAVLVSAEALGIGAHVHFLGHLSEDQFAGVWHHAGAMVFPSLHEGFGIPLLEAMHFKIPVLASSETSLPEIGADAVLFADARNPDRWAEAMTGIATDSALRQRLMLAGETRLKAFHLTQEADQFRRIIHQTIAANSPRQWNKGIHIDGWTEHAAVIALPLVAGIARVVIETAPMPTSRRLRLYRARTPFGGFALPAGEPQTLTVELESTGEPLVLEVPDAANLNPADHRSHGILLSRISLLTASGITQPLYPTR